MYVKIVSPFQKNDKAHTMILQNARIMKCFNLSYKTQLLVGNSFQTVIFLDFCISKLSNFLSS